MPETLRTLRAAALLVAAALVLSTQIAVAAPTVSREVFHEPSRARIGEPVLFFAEGLAAPVKVFFSDGTGGFVEATPVAFDLDRGVVLTHVPAGAAEGNMKIRANGVDSAPYFFRIDTSAFTPGTDVVTGRIKDGSGTGIANAAVTLFAPTACGSVSLQDFAVSDANGAYTMHGADGFYSILVFPPIGANVGAGSALTSLSGTPATTDVTLGTGSVVSGQIVDPNTLAGIPNARLSFDFSGGGFNHEEILSDPNGMFSLHVATGTWNLEVTPPAGDTTHAFSKNNGLVVSGLATPLAPIALPLGVRISGLLRRASDATPLAGVQVRSFIDSPCCTDADQTTSAGDGSFSLIVAANGSYGLDASFDDTFPLADASASGVVVTTTPVTRNLDAAEAATIAGTLTDTSMAPVNGVQVQAMHAGGFFGGSGSSCSDGKYLLRLPVDPNGYIVSTGFFNNQPGQNTYAFKTWNNTPAGTFFPCEGTPIALPTSSTHVTGIDFNLPVGATVKGTISTQNAGCADDLGNSGITIDDGTDHLCGLGQNDPSGGGGGFSFVGLPPASAVGGSLRACVSLPGFDAQCWDAQTPPSFTNLGLTEGDTKFGVDFCLANCVPTTWHRDNDHDTFGDPNNTLDQCTQPQGFVADGTDCDDNFANVHPGATEICDGRDNDCNGMSDEGNPGGGGGCATGQPGVCSAGTTTCQAGSLQCVPNVSPQPESCDGVDNNCNGQVDEGNPGGGGPCGTGQSGVCAAGTETCSGGAFICVRNTAPSAEVCDNLDNDCNGTVDGFVTNCGTGSCASTGSCVAGVDTCVANPPGVEICDGVDNNCDGQIDEGNPGGGTACSTGKAGVCAAGTRSCQGGALLCIQNVSPSAEICDGLDNDCDGTVDGFATSCGVGACASTGTCAAGVDSCTAGSPTAEVCDGADNNCNGQVDEGNPGGGVACTTGQSGVCAAGTQNCSAGALQCVRNVNPSAEVCDGLDNNCNGSTDEGNPGGGAACATGQPGVCAPGTQTCSAGSLACVRNVNPSAEVCDGADNDCNGAVDNGNPGGGAACSTGLQGVCAAGTTSCAAGTLGCVQSIAASAEICDNLDNDCNGTVDGFATACGVGRCAANGTCAAGVDTCVAGTPLTEVCNGVDDDCDGMVDNVGAGACTLFITDPLGADVLDCRTPLTLQPTITWNKGPYDTFKVFISTAPTFPSTKRVSSGDKLLTTSSWHVTAKAWNAICKKAVDGGPLFVKIKGVDIDVPKSNPAKKLESPIVAATADK